MASNKKQLISNYFKINEAEYPSFIKAAKYGTGFLVLGFLLLYLQFIDVLQNVNIVATISFLIGLFSLWLWIKPYFPLKEIFYKRPSDEDMDAWFLEDMHTVVVPKALEHFKINKSDLKKENIIVAPYPVYWAYPGVAADNIIRRKGGHGFLYEVWAVQILIVTDNFISRYSCIYDWLDDSISDEKTNEYFFDDISSVKNDIENIGDNFIDNEESKIGTAKIFKLTNMSGDFLTVITEIPSLEVPETYTNNLEKLVSALRVILRHRRYGIEIEPKEAEAEAEAETEEKKKNKAFFHQQLREIYNDYSKELEEQKKKYREYRKDG